MRKNQNEHGRSMVEILGVLAIIGVLSIGGIQGYRYAMEKHRANDIVNEVNLRTRDTWNMYQTKDLPDEKEITEWADMTQTGFPIGVYPRSEILFDVEVENVPNGVCKKVLNMDIQGPLFIWVPNGEERLIYNGNNPEICGEDGDEPVNMVFTTSLESFGNEEGLRGNPEDPNGRPLRYCMSDDDCADCAICSNYTCQSNCIGDKPICTDDKGCVECELNTDCPENQICNELDNTCITIPTKCEKGKEYRSANGACIPCSEDGVVKISQDAYEYPELNIKDEESGVDQCMACGEHNVAYNANTETTYCSVGCVKGISYETTSDGCISCYNLDGTLNTETHNIPNSKTDMCASCGLDWVQYHYVTQCTKVPTCNANEFLSGTNTAYFGCVKCSENKNRAIWNMPSNLITKNQLETMCNACPEYDSEGNWSKRKVVGSNCNRICYQPENQETCSSATDENCKRQFQDTNGVCYPCNTTSNPSVGTDTTLHTLCTACGRRVNAAGYCLLGTSNCDNKTPPHFMAADGTCQPCTYNSVDFSIEIESSDDSDSHCVANCKDSSGNPTRWIYTKSNGKSYCYKKCNTGEWQLFSGSCRSCSTSMVHGYYNSTPSTETCDDLCTTDPYKRYRNSSGYCVFETCPPNGSEKRIRQEPDGACLSCNTTSSGNNDGRHILKEQCNLCGNRLYNPDTKQCFLVDPGNRGVCNNLNPSLDALDSDTTANVNNFLASYVEGTSFRDTSGNCQSCTTPNSITATQEQCLHCSGRTFKMTNTTTKVGTCSFGGCQTDEFVNISSACPKCSSTANSYISTTYQLSANSTAKCSECDEKQIMTQNSTGNIYCVPNNCAKGYEWQHTATGTCVNCAADNVVKEIGSELIYQTQCRECSRVPFSINTADNKTVWYCSQIATKGAQFIDVNGNTTNCSTSNDIEILNVQDAKALCTGCVDAKRIYQADPDGKVWCVRE